MDMAASSASLSQPSTASRICARLMTCPGWRARYSQMAYSVGVSGTASPPTARPRAPRSIRTSPKERACERGRRSRRRWAATLARSSAALKGFGRSRRRPDRSRPRRPPRHAVKKTMGPSKSGRICCTSSKPSSPGIMTSQSTRSGERSIPGTAVGSAS